MASETALSPGSQSTDIVMLCPVMTYAESNTPMPQQKSRPAARLGELAGVKASYLVSFWCNTRD